MQHDKPYLLFKSKLDYIERDRRLFFNNFWQKWLDKCLPLAQLLFFILINQLLCFAAHCHRVSTADHSSLVDYLAQLINGKKLSHPILLHFPGETLIKICFLARRSTNTPWYFARLAYVNCKVHIFWEGHIILQNLHCRFDRYYAVQI